MFKEAILKSAIFLKNWVKDNLLDPLLSKLIIGIFGLVIALSAIAIVTIEQIFDFRDTDPERGASRVSEDIFGDNASSITYLDQGWSPAASLWFYKTPQGSNMMPYDFFMVLEKKGARELFRSNENVNRYRYLPQKPTLSNPDGLPVGFVRDPYKGKDYVGLTCAACHTAQINYKSKGIRIDGGPAGADFESFVADIVRALQATLKNEGTRNRFVKNVLTRGNYKAESEVIADLKRYTERLANYITINYSSTRYGYGRLDAFGRIFNRVQENILNYVELKERLRDPRIVRTGALSEQDHEHLIREDGDTVLSGVERDELIGNQFRMLANNNEWESLGRLRKMLFPSPDAPVSYPFLWDVSYHDYLKWNGQASNAGLGPISRNAGEVIAAFATLDWSENEVFSLSEVIAGRGAMSSFTSFESSINVHNLLRIEEHLKLLRSPLWPEHILPPVDRTRLINGRSLFNKYCESCHTRISRDDPSRRVVAHMSRANVVGTDPEMAKNSQFMGFSGMLRNQYVSTSTGDVLLDRRAPIVALMTKATGEMVADASSFTKPVWYVINAAHSLVYKLYGNEIKPSVKRGDYIPDSPVAPFTSLNSYKARSLNGIWATAPYLHNGSVPTLYDLLLPKKRPGDPEDGEYRPDEFEVGSREFDPVKVGFKSSGYGGFIFNTKGIGDDRDGYTKGNSNAGHEYGIRRTAYESDGPADQIIKDQCENAAIKEEDLEPFVRDKCVYPMSREDRLDLLEYLKTL